MQGEETRREQGEQPEGGSFRVRLPGFVNDEDVGLGDVIKRVAAGFGFKPCGGCERRAATLNRWLRFTGRRGP